jgi:hypothetical protein
MLVIGAIGEFGGYATERLLDEGLEVRALVDNADVRSDRLKSLGAEVLMGQMPVQQFVAAHIDLFGGHRR